MLFREASIQGRARQPARRRRPGRWVSLVSGRLPSVCVPSHCEVLRLEGKGPIPSTKSLNLIEVGRAVLKPGRAVRAVRAARRRRPRWSRAPSATTRPQPSPVVIANGVAGLSHDTELETFYRSYALVPADRGGDVHPVGDRRVRPRRCGRLTAQIEAELRRLPGDRADRARWRRAAGSSRAAARRLLLLGGEGGALLLAFTILAAAALRRDVTDARRRLTWFGARRWQVELFTLAESAALAALGDARRLGGSAARSPPRRRRARARRPARSSRTRCSPRRRRSPRSRVAAAAGLLLYATVRAPAVQVGRLAFTPLDAAALGAVAVVLVGWARGSVDAQQLAVGRRHERVPAARAGADRLRGCGRLAARLLAPTLRALGRAGRRGPIALRLAAASLARNPGHAAIAATFLVASLGLALFAVAYRSTLLPRPARRGGVRGPGARTC